MRVMLATPTLGRYPSLEYLMSVMKTINACQMRGHSVDTAFIGGDAFVSKARNGLIQTFVDSWKTQFSADVIVFIDDDQAWDEQAFVRIIEDPHEFIAVAIPKKTDDDSAQQTFNNVMLDTDPAGNCFIENGLMRASQIGSGFIALKRGAIEKMIKAYPRQYAPGDGGIHPLHYCLFESKVEWGDDPTKIGQFWGEDLIFCKKWIALGEKIWIDPCVPVVHVGRKTWKGNFVEFLQKNCSVQLSQPANEAPKQPEALPQTLAAIEKLAA